MTSRATDTGQLAGALTAQRQGWSLIAVQPDSKEPLGSWADAQSQKASNEKVLAFMAITRAGALPNFGVVTGAISGLVVLDIDGQVGEQSASKIFADNGGRPTTVTVKTPYGWHIYFALPDGVSVRNSVRKLGDGLDVRGEGGFVVGAGSVRGDKTYAYVDGLSPEDVALAPFPTYLMPVQNPQQTLTEPSNDGLIPQGQRNSTLTALGGSLRRFGFKQEEIESALLLHNTTHCNPPLDYGEVTAIAKSIATYEAGTAPTGFNWELPGDWLDKPAKTTEWLVDKILAVGSLSMCASPQKAGKTTLLRHMSMAVATGESFLGRTVKQGKVFYLAFEDPPEITENAFRALGINAETPLIIHKGRVPQESFKRLCEDIAIHKPDLVVVDTIGRMRNGKLELNDYAQTMDWLEPLMYLAHECGTTIVLLYHDNKAGRNTKGYDAMFSIMGSVAIGATIDQLISVRRRAGDNVRSFFTIGRYGDLPEEVLEFDELTQRLTAVGTLRDVSIKQAKAKVLDLLGEAIEPMKHADVLEAIEGTNAINVEALKQLTGEGSIERWGKGKSGDPYFYQVRSAVLTTITNGRMDEHPEGREAF